MVQSSDRETNSAATAKNTELPGAAERSGKVPWKQKRLVSESLVENHCVCFMETEKLKYLWYKKQKRRNPDLPKQTEITENMFTMKFENQFHQIKLEC